MLAQITPIVLTYNEAPNIRRTLGALRWAQDIVVVDSFSDDETLTTVAEFPQVRVFQRRFDRHQNQWNFALKETGITSEWVLAIDADYVLTSELVEEIKALQPPAGVDGYQASFIYCVHGKPLRGSAYPPVTVLYRRERAAYQQDGHTQRVVIDGEVRELHSPILHDDRKPLERWVASQLSYSALEAQRIASRDSYRFRDRLRELGVMPVIAGALAYIRAGGPFRGAAAVRYAYERAAYESLLAIRLMSLKLEAKQKTTTEAVPLQTPKLTDPDAK